MSGVVDEHGQQWEKCHTCGNYVRFPDNLGYTAEYKAHICIKCVNKLPQKEMEAVIPAPGWKANYA
jgi:hypothetical protein